MKRESENVTARPRFAAGTRGCAAAARWTPEIPLSLMWALVPNLVGRIMTERSCVTCRRCSCDSAVYNNRDLRIVFNLFTFYALWFHRFVFNVIFWTFTPHWVWRLTTIEGSKVYLGTSQRNFKPFLRVINLLCSLLHFLHHSFFFPFMLGRILNYQLCQSPAVLDQIFIGSFHVQLW